MDNNSDAPSKVIINGQEFDEAEASTLIEKGRMTSEYEQKWNTPLDKVWPEFGKSRDQLKSVAQERDSALAELQTFRQKAQEGTETQRDVANAQNAATKLGMSQEEFEKAGFVKKDQLESWFEEKYQTKRQQDQAVEQVLKEADKLATELDGGDGRPKFNKKAVMAYASAYGINDLQAAYEDMHDDAIKAWKQMQIDKEKKQSLRTMNPGGAKQPNTPKVNDDNFKANLKEKLWGTQE